MKKHDVTEIESLSRSVQPDFQVEELEQRLEMAMLSVPIHTGATAELCNKSCDSCNVCNTH